MTQTPFKVKTKGLFTLGLVKSGWSAGQWWQIPFIPAHRKKRQGELWVLSSRPAWSTRWVPRQSGLHRETVSWKKGKKEKGKERKNAKEIILELEGQLSTCCCCRGLTFSSQNNCSRDSSSRNQQPLLASKGFRHDYNAHMYMRQNTSTRKPCF